MDGFALEATIGGGGVARWEFDQVHADRIRLVAATRVG
jgi:hypothetical protein